ncbi:MAG: ATP-dependent helicase [Desulfovibrio sp.]|nr:ATP-dependent helicase [Desulfovibrio sp.]
MIDYAKALNEAQLAAVTCGNGPVLVVAGAGSGKTRTIVYRLAWLAEHGVMPDAMLLLTFTRKAAQEMLHRAGLLLGQGLNGVQGGTFHSFAYGTPRRWRPAWLGERSFTLMDSTDITAAIKQCRDALRLGKGDRSFPKSQTVVSLLSKARNKELPLEEVLRQDAWHLMPHAEALSELAEAYTAYRREKGLLDYDDLLFEMEVLLRENSAAATALRQRFSHVLVDEYQDTNLVQARIVRLLAGPEGRDGQSGNVMAVGDEAQSIYAFRGANVRNILDFPVFFPGTRVIRLEENYRSTRPVLEVANNLLRHAAESFRKRLFTSREGGDPVRLVTPLSDMSQARLVTRRIRELLDNYLPHEIAVLFRAGFHSYHLEMALQQEGIPFRKYGGLRYAEAAHIKDVVAYARLVLNPLDMPAFARVAAMYTGIGPKTVEKLYGVVRSGESSAVSRAFARFPGFLADMRFVEGLRVRQESPTVLFTSLLEHYRPHLEQLYPEDWPRRLQGLEELLQMAAGYAHLDLFVADLALESPEEDGQDDRDEGRVTLSTVHSAKGLEWNAVLVIDLVEDRFPSRHALTRPEDFEEERRLMYVACTRARRQLDLYAPASIYSRAERGSLHVSQSPFVRELSADLVEAWLEGYGGVLSRQQREQRSSSACFQLQPTLREEGAFDDCQLTTGTESVERHVVAPQREAEQVSTPSERLCHCRHRIFGRGKIIRYLPPDKVQVNFPGFGLKIILRDYLIMES